MTERQAYVWNWILGIVIISLIGTGIAIEIKYPTVGIKPDFNRTNDTTLIMFINISTGDTICYYNPQDSAKIDSTLRAMLKNN